MRLGKAASYFNDSLCSDGYTGVPLFRGQLALYDDTKRDAEVAERRVLSLDPKVCLPERLVVQVAGTRFILGHGTPDQFRGRTIRVGYVAHEAPHEASIRTLGQVCTGAAGTKAWVATYRTKGLAFTEQSSEVPDQMHVHLARVEALAEDMLVSIGTQHLLVRSMNEGPAGTLVAVCDEMPPPVIEDATVTTGSFNPVSNAIVGASVTTKVVRLRWQSLFEYRTGNSTPFMPGEVQFAVAAASATPTAGTLIQVPGGLWLVSSVLRRGDAWICRASCRDRS